jgi:rare lipoprotein A
VLTLLLGGCAGPELIVRQDDRPGRPPAIFDPKPVEVQHGKASYYWQGKRTANGERFNPEGLTAAHRKLPINTWVRVINERNGKSVIVRINDRGPFIRGRIIDLARGAAREIDMIKAGVVPVRVEVLKRIDTVEKPNLRLTETVRKKAEQRTQVRPSPTPSVTPAPAPAPAPASSKPKRPRSR